MGLDAKNSPKQPKRSQNGKEPPKIPDFVIKSTKLAKIVENGQKNYMYKSNKLLNPSCPWFQLMRFEAKNSQKQPKRCQNGKEPQKIPDFIIKSTKLLKIVENGQKIYLYESDGFPNPLIIVSVIPIDGIWGKSSTWEIKFICCNFDFKLEFCCITWFRVFLSDAICCIFPTPKK